MFALFYSLYLSMFLGSWENFSIAQINLKGRAIFNALGTFFTSLFNNVDTPMANLGDILFDGSYPNYLSLVAIVLSLITSIGIVVVAVKGVKRAFGIFFMGINRL